MHHGGAGWRGFLHSTSSSPLITICINFSVAIHCSHYAMSGEIGMTLGPDARDCVGLNPNPKPYTPGGPVNNPGL